MANTNTLSTPDAGEFRASPSPASASTLARAASPYGLRSRPNTITVYGPRHASGQGEKVQATVNHDRTDRLMVTFHNLVVKGKEEAPKDPSEAQNKKNDEAVHVNDQLAVRNKDE